eukprot:1158743-Pelagomonas_calceolata.AAC.30
MHCKRTEGFQLTAHTGDVPVSMRVFSVPALSLMMTEPSKQPMANRWPSGVHDRAQMREETCHAVERAQMCGCNCFTSQWARVRDEICHTIKGHRCVIAIVSQPMGTDA